MADLFRVDLESRGIRDWLLVAVAWGRGIPLSYSKRTAIFVAMLRPFQADSTETEVTPPTSSAASATVLEDIIDTVDMDPGLTANDAEVLTSAEIMYNPFDRPPGEEVVEAQRPFPQP